MLESADLVKAFTHGRAPVVNNSNFLYKLMLRMTKYLGSYPGWLMQRLNERILVVRCLDEDRNIPPLCCVIRNEEPLASFKLKSLI